MSLPFNNLRVGWTLKDLLDLVKSDIFLSMNCHAVGTIQSFNPSKQTVTVTINYKMTYFETDTITGKYQPVYLDYPLLIDVPVVVLQGGSCALTFPIQKGDTCLLLFNDREIDGWFQSGQVGPIETPRLHSISDGVALVGIRSAANPLSSYDSSRAVLRNGTTKLGVGSSLIQVTNAAGNSLGDLLQELITDVKNLVTQVAAITVTGVTSGPGVSGVPVNAAAITAISTQLTTTATKLGGLLE